MKSNTACIVLAFVLAPMLSRGVKVAPPFSLTQTFDGGEDDGALSVADMGEMFQRSTAAHQQSMSVIAKSLSLPKAMQMFKKLSNATAMEDAIISMIGGESGTTALRGQVKTKQPTGYGGIDGARKMLNDMIFESMTKYDEEIAKCTEFYSKQCALMEVARGQIAAANYVAANSRALILDAQGNINKCEVAIPSTKQELREHNDKCAHEVKKLNTRLELVLGDIAVMTMILKMTDCDAKFVQMKKLIMLRCQDECDNRKNHLSFNHKELQNLMKALRSPVSTGLLQTTMRDMFDPNAPQQMVTMMQVDSDGYQEPVANKTKFNNPPVPRTKVPGNPCKDPNKGAPSLADKRAAKCTLSKGPQCYKLQSRFLAIQGGIADERDELLENKAQLEADCKEQKETLETAIENDQDLLDSSQTKLAMATEKESNAGEEARQTAKENEQYNNDLIKQMKTCSLNYISFETEICALKKIRGELYKLKGSGHSAFFQDCEVSKWDPEECTKVCGGGDQKLIRSVLTPRKEGTKCLPLTAMKSCNNFPCPVDCKLAAWGGWSKCSADCGGGVQQRVRDVVMAMKYEGKPCSAKSQAKACNIAACEKDCELGPWTKFTSCSKDCDGGTRMKEKFVAMPAEGSGKCPSKWSEERLKYKPCNERRCKLMEGAKTKTCNTTMDVILVIDTCPKSGEKAFAAELAAAKFMVDAFTDISEPMFSIIRYCGPKTWSGVSKCTGKNSNSVDVAKDCHVKVHMHFDPKNDKKTTKNLLDGLEYASGTKLTSLALQAAKSELGLGRKSSHSVAIVFQDGQPLSFRKTGLAARNLRRSARLLFVVVSKFAPLGDIKKWATRRWEENLVEVSTPKKLANPATTTAVIANICPSKIPKLEMDGQDDSEMAR